MLTRIRKNNQKGFTLIELMIVIAIIGILAAIAVPNFISYRNKAFCSAAESDAHALTAGLADYFAIPGNQTFTDQSGASIQFTGSSTITLSGNNTGGIRNNAAIAGQFIITATDVSTRCPANYQAGSARWTANVFSITM